MSTQTSFRVDDDIKRTLDLKRESNTEVINRALRLYLDEFGLDEKISELDFKIKKLENRKREFQEIRKKLDKEKEEKDGVLEDRDLVDELFDSLGWSDVYGRERCVEKLRGLSDSALKVQAGELGVDVGVLEDAVDECLQEVD